MGARQQPPGTVTGPSAVTWDSVLLSDAVPSPSVSDTLGRLPQHRRAMARPSLASPPWSGLAVPIPPWSGPCCPTRAFPTRFPEAGFGECVVEPVRRQPGGAGFTPGPPSGQPSLPPLRSPRCCQQRLQTSWSSPWAGAGGDWLPEARPQASPVTETGWLRTPSPVPGSLTQPLQALTAAGVRPSGRVRMM